MLVFINGCEKYKDKFQNQQESKRRANLGIIIQYYLYQ